MKAYDYDRSRVPSSVGRWKPTATKLRNTQQYSTREEQIEKRGKNLSGS